MDSFWKATAAARQAAGAAKKSFNDLQVVQKSKDAYKQWSEVEPFPYQALPTTTSIRLLKLEPPKAMREATKPDKYLKGDASDDEDDIHFVMETAELDRNPLFTALSYTWRTQKSHLTTWSKWSYHYLSDLIQDKPTEWALPDPDNDLRATRRVTCNGRPMMVYENLYEALRQLRRARPGEWLWIDAICINQHDDIERAAQIRIMGRIYQSAQLAVVWLGPAPRFATWGLEKLNNIANSDKPLPPNILYVSRIGNTGNDDEREDRIGSAALMAFHLVSRSYFKRVWVLQELCLARNVIYLHGKHEISLKTLLTSCEWFANKDYRRETAEFEVDDGDMMVPYFTTHLRFLPTTLEARQEFLKGNKWTLIQWLRACNGRLASDGKDYIFAGLSLVKEDHLDIDQRLQAAVTTPPPLPRRPVASQDSEGTTTDIAPSSKLPAQAPSADQSLTPGGFWTRLTPNTSASDAEVFVNAAACLLSHSSVEELLRLATRLRDKHLFAEIDFLRPRDHEAFSNLPSWTPAIGSWTSSLLSDLVSPDVLSPFNTSAVSHNAVTPAAEAFLPSDVSVSADGRTLSLSAALFDRVKSHPDKETDLHGAGDLISLLRFLDQSPAPYYNNLSPTQPSSGEEGKDPAGPPPCFLEAVACTMVAGHVGGRRITPHQAGTWLCESIESQVQEMIAITQRAISNEQDIKVKLEAKVAKRGYDINHLKTSEDDKDAKKWRICDADLTKNLEKVAEATAKLAALKARYSHLKWLPAGSQTLRFRKEDVECAQLQRRDSKEKQLEEMSVKSSINTKSTSSITDALERAKIRAQEIEDGFSDRLHMWKMERKAKLRRVLSIDCSAFEEAFGETLTWRRICLTEKGYVLLGPIWIEKGDAVMVVQGSSVPFVFASEKGDLEREMARIEARRNHVDVDDDDHGETIWAATQVQQEARLLEIQQRLQMIGEVPDNRWVLVGEAYVEGIMQGEAAASLEYGTVDVR